MLENYCEKLILLDEGVVEYYGYLNDFMKKFSDFKIYNVFCESSTKITSDILPKSVEIIQLSKNFLQIGVSDSLEISEVIKKILSIVNVYEFKEEKKTLRDLYLNFRKYEKEDDIE